MYDNDTEEDDDRYFARRDPVLLGTLSHDIKVSGHRLTDDEFEKQVPARITWDNNHDEIGVCMRTAACRLHDVRPALVRAIGKFDLVVGSDVPDAAVDAIVAAIAAHLAQ